MITKPTTLILGAGASAPYGFPTGNKLLTEVLTVSLPTNEINFQGFSPAQIRKFREALQKSGKTSVDAFLEHRPEFVDIGKIAMALALIKYEREDALFNRDGKSWYEYLFNQMNARFDDFDKNLLSILTFNYDRSLEHYLLTALVNTYGKPVGKCAEVLKSTQILHLNGDLGGLPHLDTVGVRMYERLVKDTSVHIASSRIKIIHEDTDSDPQFESAKRILAKSETICFLGFGFHHLNMKRLGFNKLEPGQLRTYKARILASSFGLTHVEIEHLSSCYGFIARPSAFDYEKLDVLQFLRETGVLLPQ